MHTCICIAHTSHCVYSYTFILCKDNSNTHEYTHTYVRTQFCFSLNPNPKEGVQGADTLLWHTRCEPTIYTQCLHSKEAAQGAHMLLGQQLNRAYLNIASVRFCALIKGLLRACFSCDVFIVIVRPYILTYHRASEYMCDAYVCGNSLLRCVDFCGYEFPTYTWHAHALTGWWIAVWATSLTSAASPSLRQQQQ